MDDRFDLRLEERAMPQRSAPGPCSNSQTLALSWRDGPEPIHSDRQSIWKKSGDGMQKYTLWIALTFCVFAASVSSAQQSHKAGLWIISTTTRIQQQGESPGNFSAAHQGQSSSEPVGLPACLTQEMIDTYGVILPPSLRDC